MAQPRIFPGNQKSPPLRRPYEEELTVEKIQSMHIELHFNFNDLVPLYVLKEKWRQLLLPKDTFNEIVKFGSFDHFLLWKKFFCVAVAFASEDLPEALMNICEILTPDRDPIRMHMELFKDLYFCLAHEYLGVDLEVICTAIFYLESFAKHQKGYVTLDNVFSPFCPKLS